MKRKYKEFVCESPKQGDEMFLVAIANGDYSLIASYIENVDDKNRLICGKYTALHIATLYKDYQACYLLLKLGADKNTKDVCGNIAESYLSDTTDAALIKLFNSYE